MGSTLGISLGADQRIEGIERPDRSVGATSRLNWPIRTLSGQLKCSVTPAGAGLAGRARLVVEVEVVDVVEGDVGESCGAAAAVLEVDFFESFGDDLAHLLVAGSGVAGVEEALCVLRGEVDGEAAEASVVGGADGCGVSEPGPGLHRDPGCGGGLFLAAFAYLWLPAGAYGVVDFRGDVGAGVFAGAAAVAVDGVGGDPDLLRDRAGAAQLPDQ